MKWPRGGRVPLGGGTVIEKNRLDNVGIPAHQEKPWGGAGLPGKERLK